MIEGRALRATDADRRKMRRFIASQLVDGEGCFVLASGHDGAINVHLAVEGNDLTIESDEPEAVSLSDVYEHYRWRMAAVMLPSTFRLGVPGRPCRDTMKRRSGTCFTRAGHVVESAA